jgi:hypothetical protein
MEVVLGEAEDAARFFEKYWPSEIDPKTKKVTRLGLESLGHRLPKSTGEEIRALIPLAQQAHLALTRTVDRKSPTVEGMARGRAIVGDITAALEWLFDDGVEDRDDAELAAVEQAHHDDPQTADAMALALEDFAGLARTHVKKIDGVGGFDANVIDEAEELAKTLRAAQTVPGFTSTPESKAAMGKRNRYLQLLTERVDLVRKSARFVYRDHPEVARKVMSVYVQRRRANAKRRAATAGGDVAATPPATTTPGATNGGAAPTAPQGA